MGVRRVGGPVHRDFPVPIGKGREILNGVVTVLAFADIFCEDALGGVTATRVLHDRDVVLAREILGRRDSTRPLFVVRRAVQHDGERLVDELTLSGGR